MRIVLGIGGGIAAYKAAMLLRLFSKAGHRVIAIPTESALQFIGAPTLEALSGQPVFTSVFDQVSDVNHVRQGEQADALLIAPATADLLARLASGRANDLLTATVLTTKAPVLVAPAMHTQMWEHPATQANIQRLKAYGYHIIEPVVGPLTGPDSGMGRLPEPEDIFTTALEYLQSRSKTKNQIKDLPLSGSKILVTAGGTREPLDPVRYLANRSSGKQGIALAKAAQRLGGQVTLVHAHIEVEPPAGIKTIAVSTAQQLAEQVYRYSTDADLLIMAAAVADFRPQHYEQYKIKKSEQDSDIQELSLVKNPDILKEVVSRRRQGKQLLPQLILGFAAETGSAQQSILELGRAKIMSKGCDFLALNQVGAHLGFGSDHNRLLLLDQAGSAPVEFTGSKDDLSLNLLLHLAQHLSKS